jgi:hypothetical protein
MPHSRRVLTLPASLWLLLLLPGCADGCNPVLQVPEAEAPVGVVAPNRSRVKAVPEAISAFGVRLPLRTGPLGELVPATSPSRPFAHKDLNKRFWLLLGPKGMVLNERESLPPGPMAAGDVAAQVSSGLVDWQNRSGVQAKGAVLLLDEVVDPETAKQVIREVRAAKSMEVTMLFRAGTATDSDAVEVAVPGGL